MLRTGSVCRRVVQLPGIAPLLAQLYQALALSHAPISNVVLLAAELDHARVAADPEPHALPVCAVLNVWSALATGMLVPAAVQALLQRNRAAAGKPTSCQQLASAYLASGLLWAAISAVVPLLV